VSNPHFHHASFLARPQAILNSNSQILRLPFPVTAWKELDQVPWVWGCIFQQLLTYTYCTLDRCRVQADLSKKKNQTEKSITLCFAEFNRSSRKKIAFLSVR
jgi:hypothetical protein